MDSGSGDALAANHSGSFQTETPKHNLRARLQGLVAEDLAAKLASGLGLRLKTSSNLQP